MFQRYGVLEEVVIQCIFLPKYHGNIVVLAFFSSSS